MRSRLEDDLRGDCAFTSKSAGAGGGGALPKSGVAAMQPLFLTNVFRGS